MLYSAEIQGKAYDRSPRLVATSRSHEQKGAALLVALFALSILTLLGLGMMTSTSLETKVNSNARSSYPAYYAAEAGLEEATYRLRGGSINAMDRTQVDSASEVIYLRQSSSVDPTSTSSPYFDSQYSSSSFSTVNYVTTNQASNPIPYQWVKISLKTKRLSGNDVNNGGLSSNQDVPVYYDGAQYLYDPVNGINAAKIGFPIYQLTSFARTPDGSSCILRREVSSAAFPGMPGAIFFNGPSPTFAAPNSNPYWVIGNDAAGGANKPAIAVTTDAADTSISAGLPRPTHYIGSGGTTPDVQNVAANLPYSYTTPQGMEDLATSIASLSGATTYGSGTTTCSGANCWGTSASPKINVFDGDCSLGNGTGYGVLVVRGNFHMQGNGSFTGLILIVGQGTMSFNGGGNGQITGGIFVAKTRDSGGNVLSTLGSPSINWNGGGGNGIQYNSAMINQNFANAGYLKLAYKEISQ
jgi:Tfp pilus assembly protein PilX